MAILPNNFIILFNMSKTPTFKQYLEDAQVEAYGKLGYSPQLDEDLLQKSFKKEYPDKDESKEAKPKVKEAKTESEPKAAKEETKEVKEVKESK